MACWCWCNAELLPLAEMSVCTDVSTCRCFVQHDVFQCAFLQRRELFVERAEVSGDMLLPSWARGSVGTKVQRRKRRSVKREKEAKSWLAGECFDAVISERLMCTGRTLLVNIACDPWPSSRAFECFVMLGERLPVARVHCTVSPVFDIL